MPPARKRKPEWWQPIYRGKMQIEQVAISELIPYAKNSRTHSDEQVAQIAASIKEFGWTNPILIDGESGIIAGHGRLLAARKLGMKEVPVIQLSGMTDTQKRAYIIADNKLALNAGWDDELLGLELGELELEGFDLELTGFTQEEIDALNPEQITEGLTDEDAVPEPPVDPATRLGDVWILGKHRLMCGDSTSIDSVETLTQGHKVDLVFTDPPYGVDYKGIKNDDRSGLEDLLRSAFGNFLTVAKSGASIYVFHSDRCADIFHRVFREFFHFSSMIIWAKNSLTLSQTDYQSMHEPCIYGWMDNGTHVWHSDRKQTSVWRFDKERVDGHTTPKPVELVAKAINNSSKGGDSVIDLFGGSGSTLIACEKTGRHARLMELDPKYVDVIVRRWQEFTGKQATLEATGQTFDDIAKDKSLAIETENADC
jgi:DNA modification methylase